MKFMGKFFCPKCKILTYGLRYIFQEKSKRPKGDPQYCKKCMRTFPQVECIGGENY